MKFGGRIIVLLAATSIGLMAGCKKDDPDEPAEFDKGALVTHLADDRIIPAINDFASAVNDLESAYLTFQGDLSTVNLEVVRDKWKAAYLKWQGIKVYDFGPVRDYGLKAAMATFPTDTSKINANISGGSYTLSAAANIDAVGFPALDYLLFRVDALNYFVGNSAYTTYGLDVIQKMKSEITLVQSAWSSYRATFVTSTGTESTSAFSELINEYNRDLELCKNAKLGIPIGKQSLGVQLPEYLEARRSGFSFELLRENAYQLYLLYSGCYYGTNASGTGFDDYLGHLGKSDVAGMISANFQQILTKIDGFSGTLEQEMQNNPGGLDELYLLFQNQVVAIKTDMTSAFGVLITYQDNDGD